jgi:tetratricopeptide (TPR) repeat protein
MVASRMAKLPATTPEIDAAINRLLAEQGAMTEKQLLAALKKAGVDLGRDPEATLGDELESDNLPFVWPLADDRFVYLPALLLDRIFTHRLSPAEVKHGFVNITPDLDTLAMLDENDFLRLPDGTPVTAAVASLDGGAFVDRGVPDDEMPSEALLLPPGLLSSRGFEPDELAGFLYTAAGLEITHVGDEISDGAAVGAALSGFFGKEDEPQPQEIGTLICTVCADDSSLFSGPSAPLGEMVESAGLVRSGDQVAPAGFNFIGWHISRRAAYLADIYGLDVDEALAVIALKESILTLEDGGEPVVERLLLEFLAEPRVAEALWVEAVGAHRHGAVALGAFAESLESTAPRRARVALRWLRGKAYDRLGAVLDAEAAFDAAESLDPAWPLPLFDLARYASDRSDAERGLALLRRAGASPDDELVELLERFRPPAHPELGRNQPCWCGSGRKYKQCHQHREQLSLPERAPWLYHKAQIYLSDGPWRTYIIEVATARSEYWDAPGAVYVALKDPLVLDAILFEGGGLAEFLDERGELLPDDEKLLATQWLIIERSLYEIESVRGGEGFTARDLRTGDHHDVQESLGSRDLEPGMLICTHLLPTGDATMCFGGIEPIGMNQRDDLIALLDGEPDPVEVVEFLSRRFAPPVLQNTEGHPMVVCEATLRSSKPKTLAAALDRLYDRDDTTGDSADDAGPRWTETVVTHGMTRVRAMLRLDGGQLHVETNSEQRLDDVLATLATIRPRPTLIEDIRRPADDMMEAVRRGQSADSASTALDPSDPHIAAALSEYIRTYEHNWLDESIPALAGLTPRQAADDPTRRPDLIRLLDSFPPDRGNPGAMSADRLRAALGLT